MNRKIISFFLGAAIVASGCIFTSCNDNDDDDDITKPDEQTEATTATAQGVLYFTDSMLGIYDITYAVDGDTVVVTEENSDTTSYDMGLGVYKVRKYVAPQKAYKIFPATMKITAEAKVKAGKSLETAGTFDYFFVLDKVITNDKGNAWGVYDNGYEANYLGEVNLAEPTDTEESEEEKAFRKEFIDDMSDVELTADINFSSASQAQVNYSNSLTSKK